MRISLHIAI